MLKNKIIDHLKNDIYCRIGVSKINGVGVIALKDIPPNIDPFKNLSTHKNKIIKLYDNDLKDVDINVIKLIKDFFGNNNSYDVLYDGPNNINISFYLNHSENPNIKIIDDTINDYYSFLTNKFIKCGDELTINYNEYNN
jgi:hypothetical protein